MSIYYSPSVSGFFSDDVHLQIPQDATEISVDWFNFLQEGQSKGKCISHNDQGQPILVEQQSSTNNIVAHVKEMRSYAYARESDPIFFKVQRGEASMEDWHMKINEIRSRYPMP